jgi:hypothetical protein
MYVSFARHMPSLLKKHYVMGKKKSCYLGWLMYVSFARHMPSLLKKHYVMGKKKTYRLRFGRI